MTHRPLIEVSAFQIKCNWQIEPFLNVTMLLYISVREKIFQKTHELSGTSFFHKFRDTKKKKKTWQELKQGYTISWTLRNTWTAILHLSTLDMLGSSHTLLGFIVASRTFEKHRWPNKSVRWPIERPLANFVGASTLFFFDLRSFFNIVQLAVRQGVRNGRRRVTFLFVFSFLTRVRDSTLNVHGTGTLHRARKCVGLF